MTAVPKPRTRAIVVEETVPHSPEVIWKVLTSRELMVLRYLVLRPGRVVSRTQLLTDVWGYQYTGDDRTVDVHVSRLRRKLPSLNGRLLGIKHLGYRLDVEQDALEKSAAG